MINVATRAFLDAFFRKTAIRQESEVVGLAILQTHGHMLVRTPARIDLPRLVQFFKVGSSYAASRLAGNVTRLRLAPEYSATSVTPRYLAAAIRYLENQEEHHPGEGVDEAHHRRKTGG